MMATMRGGKEILIVKKKEFDDERRVTMCRREKGNKGLELDVRKRRD